MEHKKYRERYVTTNYVKPHTFYPGMMYKKKENI